MCSDYLWFGVATVACMSSIIWVLTSLVAMNFEHLLYISFILGDAGGCVVSPYQVRWLLKIILFICPIYFDSAFSVFNLHIPCLAVVWTVLDLITGRGKRCFLLQKSSLAMGATHPLVEGLPRFFPVHKEAKAWSLSLTCIWCWG